MIPCHQTWLHGTYPKHITKAPFSLGISMDFPFHPIPMIDDWVITQPCHVQLEFHWEICRSDAFPPGFHGTLSQEVPMWQPRHADTMARLDSIVYKFQ